ncbi:MAG: 8-oxo-dGTP diphosphatase MutT [Candidatus Omnitrophica bacterium]|nr:8-oxo-dGTP diphosphatase MutT [Candidatus Omnitrophota bacterium]
MREIEVGCAIVEKNGKILIAQRKPDSFLGGCWEFPGGKREPGETMENCVVREIREELGIEIRTRELLRNDSFHYPQKIVHLSFYLCDWVSGTAQKIDCQDFRWVDPDELKEYTFPIGDENMLSELIAKKHIYFGLQRGS